MNARVIYVDTVAGIEEIVVGSHSIELSGFGQESYCHNHRSADCLHRLTAEERDAFVATEMLATAS